eukprot:764341-Hanusia_phi.AAC.2
MAWKAVVAAVVAAGAAVVALAMQERVRRRRRRRQLANFVDIDGKQIYFEVEGQGEFTVVLDAGLGMSSLSWHWIKALLLLSKLCMTWHGSQEILARETRVFCFDRPGLGRSPPDKGPWVRRVDSIVDVTHKLLGKLNLQSNVDSMLAMIAEHGSQKDSMEFMQTLDIMNPEQLGDMPLMIVSRDPQTGAGGRLYPNAKGDPAREKQHEEFQLEQAALSRNSLRIVVEGAGHGSLLFVREDAVEAAKAILQLVDAARNGSQLR